VLARDPRPRPTDRWSAVEKAMEEWDRTARFRVMLVVMSACTVGSLILAAWFLAAHGHSVEAIYRAVTQLLGRINQLRPVQAPGVRQRSFSHPRFALVVRGPVR
jgi:hypothetical protein